MTDKQIIIDNIDVNGCEYFSKGYCYCINHIVERMSENEFCKDNPNCNYKQLKRKEQECEKAKQNAQDTYDLWQALIESFNILQGEKIKLEQECEELKEELQKYKDNEQQEKEIQKLYNKFNGNSLIKKSVTNEQRP